MPTTRTWIARASVALILAAAWAVAASADTWQIDPAHTNVEFAVQHMMISKVKGQFQKTNGTVTIDGNDPATAKIEAVIDTSSIYTRVDMRDNDLKSPRFLDVEKYPTITFKSTKIEPAGAGKWKITGDLTLHGVTKPVVLEVEGPSQPIRDPMGNTKVGASATTTINRKDFGLAYNKALEAGGMVVGDEVAISIDVEAAKK